MYFSSAAQIIKRNGDIQILCKSCRELENLQSEQLGTESKSFSPKKKKEKLVKSSFQKSVTLL